MPILLNCHPIARLPSSALPPNNNNSNNNASSSSSSPSLPHNSQLSKLNYKKVKQQQPPPPSVFEIERAIGAGIFRDRDVNRQVEDKASLLDNILKNTVGRNEGPVEKKLRESGEWLLHQTDTASRSAGKQILTVMFVWMIPLWMSAFLVASGLIHLPFLDDFFS